MMNETVRNYLFTQNLNYSDIAAVQTDENGYVTAIKIDSAILNQLKTGVTAEIAELFSDVQTVDMKVPVGTLSGSNLLAGKGFDVPFFVSYSASAQGELTNLFVTRGINQTQHQIILQISATVRVLTFGKTDTADITTQITVAETVIVGIIPEIYAGAEDEIWPNLVE